MIRLKRYIGAIATGLAIGTAMVVPAQAAIPKIGAAPTVNKKPPTEVVRPTEMAPPPQSTEAAIVQIIGGRGAGIRSAPWIVSLWDRNQYICAGAVLSPRVVVTAAHCVSDGLPTFVGYGHANRWRQRFVRPRNAIFDARFDGSGVPASYDIALLRTRKRMYAPRIGVNVTIELTVGTPAWTWGWGDITFALGRYPKWLKTNGGDGWLADYRACGWRSTSPFGGLVYGELCVENSRTCKGDSGGPATYGEGRGAILLGVVSHGEPECLDGFTVYNNIAASEWFWYFGRQWGVV